MKAYEVNFDGIVGPTHNYSGLSYGNVASIKFRSTISNPKEAALQGLRKMKFLADLGLKQAIMPPQERPHLSTLRALGFTGNDKNLIEQAYKHAPDIFFACCSASSMWTANAATIAPSADSADGRVHITPANLFNKFHRSIEAESTAAFLKTIFPDPELFVHHPALGPGSALADEGAANHTRFCKDFGDRGIELFVFGRYALGNEAAKFPTKYPARSTYEAAQAIARLHRLDPNLTCFVQQNPAAIDAGVFHNDVISVGHQNVFLFHELAFVDTEKVVDEIAKKMEQYCHVNLIPIIVPTNQVPLEDAVQSYLFNSQIVTVANGKMILLAPSECEVNKRVHSFLEELIQRKDQPIQEVHYFNLRESMQNGGGPACLRLRVVLNEKELAATNPGIFLTDELYPKLVNWVEKYYRDRLNPEDFADYQFYLENQEALEEFYNFLFTTKDSE